MKIKVNSKSQGRSEFLLAIATIYAKLLNLEKHDFTLSIDTVKSFRKSTGWNGAVTEVETRHLALAIDSGLSTEQTLITLAHEMVHVKQRVKGQLKYFVNRRGTIISTWLGKVHKTDYYDSPWEIEAFSRERVLANKVAQIWLSLKK